MEIEFSIRLRWIKAKVFSTYFFEANVSQEAHSASGALQRVDVDVENEGLHLLIIGHFPHLPLYRYSLILYLITLKIYNLSRNFETGQKHRNVGLKFLFMHQFFYQAKTGPKTVSQCGPFSFSSPDVKFIRQYYRPNFLRLINLVSAISSISVIWVKVASPLSP